MSARIYRLLRNNKEEGPFTSEELVQKKLRPYDLIWIDGRSAAWSYPGELSEFKPYTPLPGENSANQINKQQSTTVSPSVQAAIAVNNNLTQQTPKPRYKVSAAWSRIQTVTAPVFKKVMVDESQLSSSKNIAETKQAESSQAKSLSWEEAWLDWEKEKIITPAIEPLKAKTGIVSPAKTPNKNYTPPLETKYEESLDSLKDKYIENILQQKKKTATSFSLGKFSEFVLPTIALLVIFSVAYWLLHNTQAPAVADTPAKSTQPLATSNTNQPASNVNDSSSTSTVSTPINEEKQNINTDPKNETVITHAEDRKADDKHVLKSKTNNVANRPEEATMLPVAKSTSPALNKTVPVSVDKPEKKLNAPSINSDTKDIAGKEVPSTGTVDPGTENTANTSSNLPPVEKETPVTKKYKAKSSTDYIHVPSYIEMPDGSASLNVQNVSDINLDLVVIDLEYFNSYNQFRKGETIYLHNLKAGRSVIVKTPKDINSFYAISKISLISSDAENVNIVGDH